ncbi:MAG: GGDEF domain-containing protein [Chromatiales bacterium]|nr:GGDEF domain-containing protein [Chromatiales bacterium]
MPKAPDISPGFPKKLRERLRTLSSFPSPPPVALRIIELAQNPDVCIRSVADTVSLDPAIAAKVMRIANSAMYSRRRQSTNLRQALVMLGLNATLTLALSFTLVGTLRRTKPEGFDFVAYWQRTLLAATWARLLATEVHRRDAEEVFLAALLQDIGMLAIDRVQPGTYEAKNPFANEHHKLVELERSAIGADHCQVGAELMQVWGLPADLVRLVLHSHDLQSGSLASDRRGAGTCIALSSQLAELWMQERDDIAMRRISQQIEKLLDIPAHRLADMFNQIREQLPVAESLFEMSLFESDQLQEITDVAREILMVRNLRALDAVQNLQNHASKLEEENVELKQESSRDALTGAYNRRRFEEALQQEFLSARGHSWALSVIFVDLDRFKEINDTWGHQAGDAMLREVAELLTDGLRETDIVARYGGDEFVLLLPGIDVKGATAVASRIVQAARSRQIAVPGKDSLSITLSLGLATLNAEQRFEDPHGLLAAADTALYHSKRNGRNQYTVYASIQAA